MGGFISDAAEVVGQRAADWLSGCPRQRVEQLIDVGGDVQHRHLVVAHKAFGHRMAQKGHQRRPVAGGLQQAERSDAFIAMPGGIGTFEELFEVWTWRHLGYHDRPLGLLDTEAYWAPMLAFLRHSVLEGFMGDDQLAMLSIDDDADRLLDLLLTARSDLSDDDFSRV